MTDKLNNFTLPETTHQYSAGIVDPVDVQKYGMARATEIAIKKAEDKARFYSKPKPKTRPVIQN